MNFLRPRIFLHRAYTTTARPFVPPAQLLDFRRDQRLLRRQSEEDETAQSLDEETDQLFNNQNDILDDVDSDEDADRMFSNVVRKEMVKRKPKSPSFYTGRSVYYDNIIQLQAATAKVRGTLKTLDLLPLPDFALASLVSMRPMWKGIDELGPDFHNQLTGTRHRKLVAVLDELFHYYRIATTAGYGELAGTIGEIIFMFESGKKKAQMEAKLRRKPASLDTYGRSYTVGKRKTSSARVWMIPVQQQNAPPSPTPSSSPIDDIFGLDTESPTPEKPISYQATTILVNNVPMAEYFLLPVDRERVVRALKVARVFGRFNIFAIVRGGGTTGQSGALAHGIAKGIIAHDDKLEELLRAAKLLRRDPRMVERKKTGLVKARKARTWVRR